MRRAGPLLVLIGIGMASFARVAISSGPADDLFRLVPADSGLTLAVEDLREHSKEIRESKLFEGLRQMEAVRGWLASDRCRLVERTSKELQTHFGISLEVLRDEILGDAVILALQPGPEAEPNLAQGLLLVRPRDRELIARLLKTLNQIQTNSGELDRVEPRTRGTLTYQVRRFKDRQRPSEFYLQFDDGTLAWSNSEAVIQGVIDRKITSGTGLGDNPRFQKVRRGLPDRALVSLFVNPRMIERLMTDAARSSKTAPDPPSLMLTRYLAAVTQVGFAIEWRDGLMLHSHEVLEPEKLDPWLRKWLTRPASPVVSLANVPSTAVAVISANLDFEAIGEAARELISNSDRASIANLKLVAQGILLGHDPMTWIVPRLNSTILLYLDVEPDPNARPSMPWVAVVGWSSRDGLDDLTGPIDNALRTLFAFVAVDNANRPSKLKVETRTVGEARTTALLDEKRTVVAYRSFHDQLTLSNSLEAIARLGNGSSNPTLSEFRAKYAANAETFLIVDAQRLAHEVKRLQGPIAKKLAAKSRRAVDATERDLAQLIELVSLFRAFTFATLTTKDATEIHRSIGFIAR